jgi:hypothetical protein
MEFFAAAKDTIDKSVSYTGRGTGGISPGDFQKSLEVLFLLQETRWDILPRRLAYWKCMIFAYLIFSEAEYQLMYPDGVTPCKFHGWEM